MSNVFDAEQWKILPDSEERIYAGIPNLVQIADDDGEITHNVAIVVPSELFSFLGAYLKEKSEDVQWEYSYFYLDPVVTIEKSKRPYTEHVFGVALCIKGMFTNVDLWSYYSLPSWAVFREPIRE